MDAMLIGKRGASVTLKNLTKTYREVEALRSANLHVESGEFVTLLGPSGSGKTTALMMIAGFITPTAGDILVDGQSICATPSYKRNLGMVFQHYSLFPHMSVYENIAFPLEMRHMRRKEIRERVTAVLELVRLPGYEHRRLNQMSGGQQQRIALARALVYEPAVVLLDEPLGALDLKLRQELQVELLHLHQRLGTTMISVTHDQGEALSMSNRVVVMNGGLIQQTGAPAELYKRPVNRFVADFIGESNFVTGTARIAGKQKVLETSDGLRMFGTGFESVPNGKTIAAILRPECVVSTTKLQSSRNVFRGIVEEAIYLGDTARYTVRLGAQTTITTKLLLRAAVSVLKRGDELAIGWAAEDLIIVDENHKH